MIGKLLIVAAVSVFVCQAADIKLMLKDVGVYPGQTATIPCDFETSLDGNPTIRWYERREDGTRKRLYIYIAGDDTSTGKDAAITRELEIGPNGELIIPNTTLADNKLFKTLICEVELGTAGSEEGTLNFVVGLKAVAEPTTKLTKQDAFHITGDEQIIGNCISDFAYPQPIVEYYKGSKSIHSAEQNGSKKVEAAEVGGFLNAFVSRTEKTTATDGVSIKVDETLQLNLTGADDNAQYFCVVRSGINGEFVQNVSFPLFRVLYPTNEVVITADKAPAKVGDTITFTCSPNGNPEPTIADFGGQTTSEYQMTVTKEDDGQVVTCTAGNGPDNSVTGYYTVSVAYMDSPIITGSKTVAKGSPLTLQCNAQSNQEVTYMWSKDGEQLNLNGMTLTLDSVDFDDSGEYKCTATTAVGIEGESTAQVTVNGIEYYGSDVKKSGDMAVLSCSFLSNPQPKIVWMRVGSDNEVAGSNSSHDMAMMSYTSYLSVGPLDSSFKEAEYACKASNEAVPGQTVQETLDFTGIAISENPTEGQAVTAFASREKETTNSEFPNESSPPIAGIIIGILVALLVVAIILAVLYNKGIICKSDEKGDENAEDIAVDINKDESPDDLESGRKPMDGEDEKLVNGNDQ